MKTFGVTVDAFVMRVTPNRRNRPFAAFAPMAVLLLVLLLPGAGRAAENGPYLRLDSAPAPYAGVVLRDTLTRFFGVPPEADALARYDLTLGEDLRAPGLGAELGWRWREGIWQADLGAGLAWQGGMAPDGIGVFRAPGRLRIRALSVRAEARAGLGQGRLHGWTLSAHAGLGVQGFALRSRLRLPPLDITVHSRAGFGYGLAGVALRGARGGSMTLDWRAYHNAPGTLVLATDWVF